jgi:hypothetical protein
MEEDTLKKIVTIGGQKVELFSLDSEAWSSDLRQFREREKARQKAHARALAQARTFSRIVI